MKHLVYSGREIGMIMAGGLVFSLIMASFVGLGPSDGWMAIVDVAAGAALGYASRGDRR